MTRRAISPRFATRTLVTLANRHQYFVGRDDRALFGEDLAHRPSDGGDDVVLHFHRLQNHDHVAETDPVTGRHPDLDHHPLHWRLDGPIPTGSLRRRWPGGHRGRNRRLLGGDRVAPDPDLVGVAVHLHGELPCRRHGRGREWPDRRGLRCRGGVGRRRGLPRRRLLAHPWRAQGAGGPPPT